MTLRSLSLRLALLFALLFAPASPAADGPATAAIKAANDSLRTAIKKMSNAKGPAYDKARDEAKAAVGSLIDFDAVAQATLGKRWDELKPPQHARYIAAVRGAMEASYLSKMRGKMAVDDVKVAYLGEEPKDAHTLVKTKFTYGEDVASLGFVVTKAEKGKKARAIDVITEDVSLVETYRDQIKSLWAKKGFEGVAAAFEKKKAMFEKELKEKSAAN